MLFCILLYNVIRWTFYYLTKGICYFIAHKEYYVEIHNDKIKTRMEAVIRLIVSTDIRKSGCTKLAIIKTKRKRLQLHCGS